MDFEKIALALGIDGELNEKNATDEIVKVVDEMKLSMTETVKKVDDLTKETATLKEAALKNSKGNDKSLLLSINPNLARQMGKTATDQLDNLVTTGRLTPAARNKAVELFVGNKDNLNIKMLSVGEDGESPVIDRVVEVISINNPVELGEKVKAFAMNRDVPGGEEGKYDPKLAKTMASL